MNLGFVLIGVIMIAAGAYLVVVKRKKIGDDLLEIQYMKTSTIGEVKEALNDMAGVSDSYREYVELKGTASSGSPQKTPFSQKDAAFYVATTYRVYEEEQTVTDSNGNTTRKLVKKEERISEEESGEDLILTDEEGNSIVIETNGVSNNFQLPQVTDRFEPANTYSNFNPFQNRNRRYQNFDHGAFGGRGGVRLLGFRMVEKAYLKGQRLYVLGEAYMNAGVLTLGRPTDKSRKFIVTSKSEEELVSSKQSSQKMTLIGGIALIAFGALIAIKGFMG